jgi:hypothetical protein
MDGDDDLDVITASLDRESVEWFENTFGDGTTWSEHTVSAHAPSVLHAIAADFDGDSDPEVLSATWNGPNSLYFFQAVEEDNDGDGVANCEGDCDDGNRFCDLDCTDTDSDGYCVTTDCDETNPLCGADCTNPDGDAACSDVDCDESDPDTWLAPSAVRFLWFESDKVTLLWTGPEAPEGTVIGHVYDTLRTGLPSDFDGAAICVEADDGTDHRAEDPDTPDPGETFYYLVRAENGCGASHLGTDSDGFARWPVRECP